MCAVSYLLENMRLGKLCTISTPLYKRLHNDPQGTQKGKCSLDSGLDQKYFHNRIYLFIHLDITKTFSFELRSL